MFTLRRYTSADQEAVEHLHVFAIQQETSSLITLRRWGIQTGKR
jgi:hypothetical protein